MLKGVKNIPLMNERYVYVGEDNKLHKKGETYKVVETGYHWVKEYGFVIWMTTEEYRDGEDIDFCMSMSPTYFKKNFWKS